MMSILDKYIAEKFIKYFIISVAAFVLIFLIVDIVENIDKYIDKHAKVGDVALYYIYYIPYIIVLVFPIAALLASTFLGTRLSKNLEIVAFKSLGIPTIRVARAIFVLGIIISAIAFLAAEFVIPSTNRLKAELADKKLYKKFPRRLIFNNLFYIGDDGSIYYFRSFDSYRGVGVDVTIIKFAGGKISERYDIKRLSWIGGSWLVNRGILRKFTKFGEELKELKNYYMYIPERPEDFARKIPKPEELSITKLWKLVNKLSKTGIQPKREATDLWMKIAYPLVNFIVLLWGFPLSARLRKANYFLGFGQSFFIAFIYLAAIRAGQALGYNGDLPPYIAAFIGDAIFGAIGAVIVYVNRD